jgi:hypothetical protein
VIAANRLGVALSAARRQKRRTRFANDGIGVENTTEAQQGKYTFGLLFADL